MSHQVHQEGSNTFTTLHGAVTQVNVIGATSAILPNLDYLNMGPVYNCGERYVDELWNSSVTKRHRLFDFQAVSTERGATKDKNEITREGMCEGCTD